MGTLSLAGLPDHALLLLDSPPIIYFLEGHETLRPRFKPLFDAQGAGQVRFAVTPITVGEVMTGPFKSGDEAFARRYRATLDSWEFVPLSADIAEAAARFRATVGLNLADAFQAASAVAINAAALVTHDRDFSRLRSLRVIS